MSNHPEWSKENTLTAPSDRNPEQKFQLDQGAEPLSAEQLQHAVNALNNTSFVERFPQVERRYADPPVDLQRVGLISFVPAKGAQPNDKGVFGFAKLRGNYATEEEASERATYLIRNVDSYHQIYHTYVGRPFPITFSSDYSKEVDRVELRKETVESISEDVRKKREKEQQDIEEIKQREQELLSDVSKEKEDDDDHYTTLRVKKAQLMWTYNETKNKLEQMRGLIAKTRREIELLDKKQPELSKIYYQKYVDAREKAGLRTDKETTDTSFMKYLAEDLVLPELEEEYRSLYGDDEKSE